MAVAQPASRLKIVSLGEIFSGSATVFNTRLAILAVWLTMFALVALQRGAVVLFGIYPHIFLTFPILIWAAILHGRAVFTRHYLDVVFGVWLVLGLVSQLWASVELYRVFGIADNRDLIATIFSPWLLFRAFYALGYCFPKVVPKHLILSMLGSLGFMCFIGLLQWQGPGPTKTIAETIARTLSPNYGMIDVNLSLETGSRIQSFTHSPTHFGFYCSIAVCVICGWIVSERKRTNQRQAILGTMGILFFMAGIAAGQARLSMVFSVLAILLCCLIFVRQRNFVASGMIIASLVAGFYVLFTRAEASQTSYLTQLGQGGIQRGVREDESLKMRARSFSNAWEHRDKLALLGAGWTARNMNSFLHTGDIYDAANGVDNSWMNAFVANGVLGIVLVVFLLYLTGRMALDRRFDDIVQIRVLRWICIFLWLNFLLTSFMATRYAKVDQMSLLIVWFAAMAGVSGVITRYGPGVVSKNLNDHRVALSE